MWRAGQIKGRYDDEPRDQPMDYGDLFNLTNHPVVCLTWYQALAFTRWLTERWREQGVIDCRWAVRLPSEANEATALAGQARITIEQAKVTALATNPRATVVKAELDNENGALVYSVELSTVADVKVDAGNGAILHTDTGHDSGKVANSPDTDNVQDGQGQQVEDGQPDVPGAVEAPDAAPQAQAL